MSLKGGVTVKGGSGRLHHRTDNRIRSPRLAAYGTTGEGKLGNSAKWTRNFGIRVASFWQFVSGGALPGFGRNVSSQADGTLEGG